MAITIVPAASGVYVRYVRVSSIKQDKDGYGPARQRSEIEAYAEFRGLSLGTEYYDDVSGTLESRPALDKLFTDLRNNPHITGIIIAHPDRLAREVWIGAKKLKELHRRGLDVHFCNLGSVPDSDDARFMCNMHFSMAELDRGHIMKKLNAGKQAKVTSDNARPLNIGIAPLGYQFVGRKKEAEVVINEAEADIVRRIYDLYIKGTSIPTIVAMFEQEQVPTVEDMRPRKLRQETTSERGKQARPAKPSKQQGYACWNRAQIRRVLKSPIYKGAMPVYRYTMNYQRADGTTVRSHRKGLDDPTIVWLTVPAIVPAELWEKAQRIRNDRRREATDRHEYLLTHRLRCTCGYARHGWLKTRGTKAPQDRPRKAYYRCTGCTKDAVHRCRAGMVAADELDAAVWRYVESVLLDPENLRAAYEQQSELQAGEREEWEREGAELRAALADVKARTARLLDIELSGTYSPDIIEDKQAELRRITNSLTERSAAHEAKGRDLPMTVQWGNVEALQQAIAEAIDTATVAGRRAVLEILGVTVEADKQVRRIRAEIDAGKVVEIGADGSFKIVQSSARPADPARAARSRPPRAC